MKKMEEKKEGDHLLLGEFINPFSQKKSSK
jgi:hypothetical protein